MKIKYLVGCALILGTMGSAGICFRIYAQEGAGTPPAPSAPRVHVPPPVDSIFNFIDMFVRKFRDLANAGEPLPESMASKVTVVDTIELASILDQQMNTRTEFATGVKTPVHISGNRANNCSGSSQDCKDYEKYFIVFHTDTQENIFVKGTDIANVPFLMHGEKDIYFTGDKTLYQVKLMVNVNQNDQSELKIWNRQKLILDVTAKDLAAALFEKARPVKMSREYYLFYYTDLLQDFNGAGYLGKDKTFLLMRKDDNSVYYTIPASKIDSVGVNFPDIEKDYGFRIKDGNLEIYKMP